MKGVKALFQIRETYIGIAAAIAFQLIFFAVWMTAYDGVNDRSGNLSVGLLNEDSMIGQEIAKQIYEKVPFNIKPYTSIEQAQSDMNERKIEMIIQIPETLTESIESGTDADIVYWINQSNASLTKTMMENTSFHLTEQVNRNLYPFQINKATAQFTQQIKQLSVPKELADLIGQSVGSMLNSLTDRPIGATITKINDVEEFAANLIPLMLIISSFAGAMVMVMQHEEAAQSLKKSLSKWKLFFGRQTINIGVAFLLPLLTMGLMGLFQISSQEHFLMIYLFQSIMFLAFLSLAQVFVFIFGNLGMVFNIGALSLQLVTSDVLVPKAMLSNWYIHVASFLPATYGADGYYTIIFGGNSSSINENMISLVLIILVTFSISLGAVAVKEQLKKQRVSETLSS